METPCPAGIQTSVAGMAAGMNKPVSGSVLSFGEILLRICPDSHGDWLRENSLRFHIGGAEANVSSALALWGISSEYMTAMPPNYMSEQICRYLNDRNVGTSRIRFDEGRLGIFFLPEGGEMKHAGVIYDRDDSSFARLKPGTISWDAVFEGVGWLHLSAISPALNADTAGVCLEAVKAASEKGITVSLDLNYRSRLWKYGKSPADVIPHLAAYCDVIMGNIWSAEMMLGIAMHALPPDAGTDDYLRQAQLTSEEIRRRFPKCTLVANTFRFSFAETGIEYFATMNTGAGDYTSGTYRSGSITDKVGSGDCFMAGLIYGSYLGKPEAEVLEFATAAAFSKLSVPGDTTTWSAEQIKSLLQENEKEHIK